jgi:hypothetical protein
MGSVPKGRKETYAPKNAHQKMCPTMKIFNKGGQVIN